MSIILNESLDFRTKPSSVRERGRPGNDRAGRAQAQMATTASGHTNRRQRVAFRDRHQTPAAGGDRNHFC